MLASTNKVTDILRESTLRLRALYDQREASAIVKRLLTDRFNITSLSVALNPEMTLNESQIILIYNDIKKLLQGMPVQYVTGKTTFLMAELKVNSSVLIPRPETEELVMAVAQVLGPDATSLVLEIGTGSGAIAIALQSMFPQLRVMATDISIKALEVARENAKSQNCDIRFFQHDLLSESSLPGIFPDIIVSNPPYIPRTEARGMMKNVTGFEPHLALFVEDDDPLLFYRHIAHLGISSLNQNGYIFVEVHHPLAENVASMFRSNDYQNVIVLQDIHGLNRFVKAFLP